MHTKKTKLSFISIVFVTFLHIPNCATFTKHPLQQLPPFPSVEYKLQPLFVDVKLKIHFGDRLLSTESGIARLHFKDITSILRKYRCFNELETILTSSSETILSPPKKYSLELTYEFSTPGEIDTTLKPILSGLTWTIFPIVMLDRKVILSGTLKGLKGETIKKFNNENVYSSYFGILMLPLLPFSDLPIMTEAQNKIMENFTESIVQEIYFNKLIPVEN